jgi:hypothetical protein
MLLSHQQDTISMPSNLEVTKFYFLYDYAKIPPNRLMVQKSGALAVLGRLCSISGGSVSIRKFSDF